MSRFLRHGFKSILRHPKNTLKQLGANLRGFRVGQSWESHYPKSLPTRTDAENLRPNPLRTYFDGHKEGHGIYKWLHYFDVYHHHFKKFVGREVHIVEVGIYSGGSLEMWKEYFGDGCRIYGIDIEDSCKIYAKAGVEVFIGDQADRNFWREFKRKVPAIDILIDDGGHTPKQQIVTLEEMVPHLRTGGVYLCEDIHGPNNLYSAYMAGLARNLNVWKLQRGEDLAARPSEFQREIHSIHHYPYLTIIEKLDAPIELFVAPRHGTLWQPFLDSGLPPNRS